MSIGACLQQLVDKSWQPLAFFSKKMSAKECTWLAYYRELLAVYEAVQHFRHLLDGFPFTIYTDHKPPTHAFTLKKEKLPPLQFNQLSFISQFTTDIEYIKGSDNFVADAFSRVETLSPALNYEELARSHNKDKSLHDYLTNSNPSLQLKKIILPTTSTSIHCDTSTGKPRPFVTAPLRRLVFIMIHNLNHHGIRSTYKSLSARFVWPSMRKYCTIWAKTCVPCQTSKVTRPVQSPLSLYSLPTERFSHIHIDLNGPLPPVNFFKYCLTIIDRYTR